MTAKERTKPDAFQPLCSLADVAKEMGITQKSAYHLERRALRKLAKELDKRGITAKTFFSKLGE